MAEKLAEEQRELRRRGEQVERAAREAEEAVAKCRAKSAEARKEQQAAAVERAKLQRERAKLEPLNKMLATPAYWHTSSVRNHTRATLSTVDCACGSSSTAFTSRRLCVAH